MRCYILISQNICSMYELKNVYTLDEMLRVYALWEMQRDIKYQQAKELEDND